MVLKILCNANIFSNERKVLENPYIPNGSRKGLGVSTVTQGVKLSVKDPPAVPELITFSLEQKVLRERKPLLRSLLGEHQVKDFKLLRNN